MASKLNQLEIEKIIRVFRATRSVTLTSKKTGRSQTTIKRVLKSYGLEHLILNKGTITHSLAYYEQVNRSKIEVRYPSKPKILGLIKKTKD